MEIKIYKYPKDTKDLLIRDFDPNLIGEAVSAISDIINDIEENGDTALLKYERQFDCPSIESLKVTEQELLTFGLRSGDELDEKTLTRLKEAAGVSNIKTTAADLVGRRAMSRRDLEKKLREKNHICSSGALIISFCCACES